MRQQRLDEEARETAVGSAASRHGWLLLLLLTLPPVSTRPDLGSALIVSPTDGRRAATRRADNEQRE